MTRLGTSSRAASLAGALFVVGCTVEAGHGFATLEEASVSARFDAGGRLGPDGRVLVAGGYRVAIDEMTLAIEEVALDALSTSGGGGGGVFDPASPPPGYTLCHGGHCHATDGRLVSYEEIQAELSGGGATAYAERVSMHAPRDIDLLARETLALERFTPSAELDRGTLARVRASVGRFHLVGRVTGGALGDRDVALEVDLHVEAVLSSIAASRTLDRDHDAALAVHVGAVLDGRLFDGVDLASLEAAGAIAVTRGDAAEAIAQHIAAVELDVELLPMDLEPSTDDAIDAGVPDPAVLACAEVGGPTTSITATDAPDAATTPAVGIGAPPYRVVLPSSGTGYVKLETTDGDTQAILLFGSTSTLTAIYDADGDSLGATSAGAVPACATELPEHFDVDFHAPGTYFLELVSASDVWLIVSSGEGHGD